VKLEWVSSLSPGLDTWNDYSVVIYPVLYIWDEIGYPVILTHWEDKYNIESAGYKVVATSRSFYNFKGH